MIFTSNIIILCSKLHCQKYFKLKHIPYWIPGEELNEMVEGFRGWDKGRGFGYLGLGFGVEVLGLRVRVRVYGLG